MVSVLAVDFVVGKKRRRCARIGQNLAERGESCDHVDTGQRTRARHGNGNRVAELGHLELGIREAVLRVYVAVDDDDLAGQTEQPRDRELEVRGQLGDVDVAFDGRPGDVDVTEKTETDPPARQRPDVGFAADLELQVERRDRGNCGERPGDHHVWIGDGGRRRSGGVAAAAAGDDAGERDESKRRLW